MYVTVYDTIAKILKSGPNTLLANVDIKYAFCLLPIHPADKHFLTMEWNQCVYIDTCLPFELRSAPKLFNILAHILCWITTQRGVTLSVHYLYLDDFLLLGSPDSSICQHNLDIFTQVCEELDIPLATEKVEGPSTSLNFLGILLDTHTKWKSVYQRTSYSTLIKNFHLGSTESSHQKRHSITCRLALACDERYQKWENLCSTNVQYCCIAERVDFFYQAEQRLSFWPLLVVHFHR